MKITERFESIMLGMIGLLMFGWVLIGLPIVFLTDPNNSTSYIAFTTSLFAIITTCMGVYALLRIVVLSLLLHKRKIKNEE